MKQFHIKAELLTLLLFASCLLQALRAAHRPTKLARSQRTNGANEGQRTTAVGPPGPESLHTHLRPSQRDHLEHLMWSQQSHLETCSRVSSKVPATHIANLIGGYENTLYALGRF